MVHTLDNMRCPKVLLIAVAVMFSVNTLSPTCPVAYSAQGEFRLPAPGVMVHLSPPMNPPLLKGIKVYKDNPFKFDFVLSPGDGASTEDLAKVDYLKQEANRLIRYFLASLTVPDKDLWVNLSPYEKDRIIPNAFGQTEMGRDLLAQDYLLKQITASLIYPEEEVGREFWNKVYKEAQKKFGTTNIPVNTFNKVWIVPQKAVVYENKTTAYVVEAKLKVMLEEDYLAKSKNEKPTQGTNDTPSVVSQIVREIVLPQLEQEVNEGKNFAPLRQVYHSLILAAWYKQKVKQSILAKVYADKNKVAGVGYDNFGDPESIYQQYLQAFKKGVFNYIKEESDLSTQELVPRKYFSGGVSMAMASMGNLVMSVTNKLPKEVGDDKSALMFVRAGVSLPSSFAMIGKRDRDYLIKLRGHIKEVMDQAYATVGKMDIARDYGPEKIHTSPLSKEMIKVFLSILRKGPYALSMKNVGVKVRVIKLMPFDRESAHNFILITLKGEEIVVVPTWQAFLSTEERDLVRAEPLPRLLIGTADEFNGLNNDGYFSKWNLSGMQYWFNKKFRVDVTKEYGQAGLKSSRGDAAMSTDALMGGGLDLSATIEKVGELLLKKRKYTEGNFYVYYEIIESLSEENKDVLNDAINGLVQVLSDGGKYDEGLLREKLELKHPMGVFFALSIYIMQETMKGRSAWGDGLEEKLKEMLGIYNANLDKWNKVLGPFGLLDLPLLFHLPLTSFITNVDQLIKLSNSIMLFPEGEWKDKLVSFDLLMMGIHANPFLYDNDSPDLDIVVPSLEHAIVRLVNAPQTNESIYLERGIVSALWLLGERQYFINQQKEHLYFRVLDAFNKLGGERLRVMLDASVREQESSKHFSSWLIKSNLNSFLFFLKDDRLTATEIILDSHLGRSQDALLGLKEQRNLFEVRQDLKEKKDRLLRGVQVIDETMSGVKANTGGIDLTSDKLPLEVKSDGNNVIDGDFNIDPVMLKQWEEASGVVPVIFNIEPMTNIYQFLGAASESIVNQSS